MSYSFSRLSRLIVTFGVLKKLDGIENKKNKFALNYLMTAKSKGYKSAKITEALKAYFLRGDIKNFILIGDDYSQYILDTEKYIVRNEKNEIYLESENPISLEEILDKIEDCGERKSIAFFDRFLNKWTIKTIDRYGNSNVFKTPIKNLIQGFIEYGESKMPCYLIKGDWFVFDGEYSELLTNEYHLLFDKKEPISEKIKLEYNLIKIAENEQEYNAKLNEEANIIVTDTVLCDNVEIADAIFWDDEFLYLMHNKIKFDGIGTRDLLNQIITSAELIQKHKTISGLPILLDKYYTKICKKQNTDNLNQITKEDFISLFQDRKICYISGYLKNYRKDSRSTYAKYLTIETEKRLTMKSYTFIPIGIS